MVPRGGLQYMTFSNELMIGGTLIPFHNILWFFKCVSHEFDANIDH